VNLRLVVIRDERSRCRPKNRLTNHLKTTLKARDMNKGKQAISVFLPQIKRRHILIITSFLLTLTSPVAYSGTFPDGFVSTQITSSLSSPTAMAFSPDGRLFVCEKAGRLRVIKNDVLLSKPFLTVTVGTSGERGLLGVAFDPDFAVNQLVYVYYTATSPAVHNRISRFTASGDTALANSEEVLLELDNLGATNHNGGAIHFGSDGKLYAAVGENAVPSNSQTLDNLLGKVLRINPDGSIPADNPFYDTATGKNGAIWALGLRNPFTFSFQPGSTRMFINDVGQSTWEEINDGFAGSNYGWPTTEGYTSDPAFRGPLFVYGHGSTATTGCAITGGTFYNPTTQQFPSSYLGDYFFADYCSGWIRVFHPSDSTASSFASGLGAPVDLQVSTDGSLYYLDYSGGIVGKVEWEAALPVQLASFTGTVNSMSKVKLDWTTLSEVNNYGFYLERRTSNEAGFTELVGSFIPGHGTTTAPHQYSYTDDNADPGEQYYRLRQVDLDGTTDYSDAIRVIVFASAGASSIPKNYVLYQNRPNPFNPSTVIRYGLPQSSIVTLSVYNTLGQLVAQLVNERQDAGFHDAVFRADNLSSAMYFCRLQAGDFVATTRLLLLR
jgi:glucose/arabinose dehydrogenase